MIFDGPNFDDYAAVTMLLSAAIGFVLFFFLHGKIADLPRKIDNYFDAKRKTKPEI